MNVRTLAVARSVAVIGGMGALITGVTFAALTAGPATLANNTLSTATADLQISNGGDFGAKVDGFAIADLVPGAGSEHKKFYLKNSGAIDLQIAASVTKAPEVPAGGYGFDGMENLKVFIKNLGTNETLSTDMAALLAGDVTIPGSLAAGQPQQAAEEGSHPGTYEIWYDITPSAITGAKAGVGPFNLEFTGSQTVGSPNPSPSPSPSPSPEPTMTPTPSPTPTPSESPSPSPTPETQE